VVIDDGAEFTSVKVVSIRLDVSDNFALGDMRVTNDPAFPSTVRRPFESSLTWTLEEEEGLRTVYVEVTDKAGNTAVRTGSITLDLTDPEASISINLDDEATLNLSVELTWSASDSIGIASIEIKDDPSSSGLLVPLDGGTSASDVIKDHLLSGADGEKTIYLEVIDVAGRTSIASDSIWYVSSRPEGVAVLGDGSGWTNSTTIAMVFEWTDGSTASHVRYANTMEDLGDESWNELDILHTSYLPPSDGDKSIYWELLGPHNITSLAVEETITLDTVPPKIDVVKPAKHQTEDGTIRFEIVVTDSLDPSPEVEWKIGKGLWQPLTEANFTVELSEGDNTIMIRATDAASNYQEVTWKMRRESPMFVSTTSWLIIIVILVVLATVGYWIWNKKPK
jgi:hypothetical protein